MITSRQVAQILYEEFKKDGWGDIDPDFFNPKYLIDDTEELADSEMCGLDSVIERVTERLNNIQ